MKRLHFLLLALLVGLPGVTASAINWGWHRHAGPTAGAAPRAAAERIFTGPNRQLGHGTAHSWVAYRGRQPVALGVTFTDDALQGLQTSPRPDRVFWWETILPLPRQARITGFNHIAVDWNVHGHVPAQVYGVPHFDFHFYMISPRQRQQITVTGPDIARASKRPPVQYIPVDYILPPGTLEPTMGAHWIDPSSPEFHGKTFTQTLIYGFYDGRMIFIEPMITRAYLLTKPNVTLPMKLPEAYQHSGFYPTSYRIHYDPEKREYTVALVDLRPYASPADTIL